jgi:hypothetical protein
MGLFGPSQQNNNTYSGWNAPDPGGVGGYMQGGVQKGGYYGGAMDFSGLKATMPGGGALPPGMSIDPLRGTVYNGQVFPDFASAMAAYNGSTKQADGSFAPGGGAAGAFQAGTGAVPSGSSPSSSSYSAMWGAGMGVLPYQAQEAEIRNQYARDIPQALDTLGTQQSGRGTFSGRYGSDQARQMETDLTLRRNSEIERLRNAGIMGAQQSQSGAIGGQGTPPGSGDGGLSDLLKKLLGGGGGAPATPGQPQLFGGKGGVPGEMPGQGGGNPPPTPPPAAGGDASAPPGGVGYGQGGAPPSAPNPQASNPAYQADAQKAAILFQQGRAAEAWAIMAKWG